MYVGFVQSNIAQTLSMLVDMSLTMFKQNFAKVKVILKYLIMKNR